MKRYYPPLLITGILISAHLSFGILEGYSRTGIAIFVAIVAELVMGKLTYGKWPHPASAYITGISVGILIKSPVLWPNCTTVWPSHWVRPIPMPPSWGTFMVKPSWKKL